METDYYLHNLHVRAGRGTSQSMRGFQIAFGVLDWNDVEHERDGEGTVERDASQSMRLSHHRTHSRHTTLGSFDFSGYRQEEQLRRIQKVRDRCTSQNRALSIWWKIALQSNVQQRMWMKLGNSPMESIVPPRFERLYQPEKMAQFDRFFARPWATPVRRSHTAQHNSDADDDTEVAVFRRNISGIIRPKIVLSDQTDEASAAHDDETHFRTTLETFVQDYGFGPHPHTIPAPPGAPQNEVAGKTSDYGASHYYIGDNDTGSERLRQEYEEYTSPQDDNSTPFRRNALEEFQEALRPLSLGADDVDGIRKVSQFIGISP